MDINEILASQIYNKEVLISKQNNDDKDADYESYLGLLDNVRDEKNYDWQSDIRMPYAIGLFLSQGADDVNQYFATRDFVEVKINDKSDQAKKAAEASKELLNRTLNQRKLYHYQKFVRAKGICNLSGLVYLKCWWEQKLETRQIGTRIEVKELDVDINGFPLTESFQQPALEQTEVPEYGDVPVKDIFNYDVWDRRNVFVSNEYTYSLQDKEWIIFRSEVTLSGLKDMAEQNEYFDLDKLPEPEEVTDTKSESYQKDVIELNQSKAEKQFDLYERYGKYWTVDGKPGIDVNGEVLESAEYKEVIVTIVESGGKQFLIGFKETNFIDADGVPYKPCIRGICYVHLTNDTGMGDGQSIREIQTAYDDTFNLSQDKTMFSTMPMMKMAKSSAQDNSTVYLKPGHIVELNNIGDLEEIRINSDIVAALNQMKVLDDMGREVTARSETSTGGVPSIASTTATAVERAAQGSSNRGNFKSLTFENTALTELYWMIQQMTSSFAKEQTGFELMGEKIYDFNPTLDYYYRPLSQSIESESSKIAKIREWDNLLQRTIQINHPQAVKIVNYIYKEIVKLMGDEYENMPFLDENTPIQAGGQQGQTNTGSASNQYGLAQSQQEEGIRRA